MRARLEAGALAQNRQQNQSNLATPTARSTRLQICSADSPGPGHRMPGIRPAAVATNHHCGPCFFASLPLNFRSLWWGCLSGGGHMPAFLLQEILGSKWNIAPTQEIKVEERSNKGRGVICQAIKKNDKCPVEHQKIRQKISCPIQWNNRCSRGHRSWTFIWGLFATELTH